jgi:hypothetical protein
MPGPRPLSSPRPPSIRRPSRVGDDTSRRRCACVDSTIMRSRRRPNRCTGSAKPRRVVGTLPRNLGELCVRASEGEIRGSPTLHLARSDADLYIPGALRAAGKALDSAAWPLTSALGPVASLLPAGQLSSHPLASPPFCRGPAGVTAGHPGWMPAGLAAHTGRKRGLGDFTTPAARFLL